MRGATFCTCFDHGYIDRGLVLYKSLRRHFPGAKIRVLALSKECEHFLNGLNLDGMSVVALERMFEREPRLLDAQNCRSNAEFAFTMTPYVVLNTLENTRAGHHAVYLDADMMFFASPQEILQKSDAYDVTITPHNFPERMHPQARFGVYNVGWVGFKKTSGGERCAEWWANKCLEWCYDRLEDGRFADQKYLESFAKVADSTFSEVQIGLNCAPWNASGRRFQRKGPTTSVDGVPLVVYHFAKVKRLNPWCIATRTKVQGVEKAKGLNRCVYKPYARALGSVTAQFRVPHEWIFTTGSKRSGTKHSALSRDENPGIIQLISGLCRGDYVCSGT